MSWKRNFRSERDVREFIEQLGGELISACKTKHWKVEARFGTRIVKTTLAITPSDTKTRMFEATRIKRMARGHYEECGWISLAG